MAAKLDHWIDRALWSLLCAAALYVSDKIGDLSVSVNDLNMKLAIYIERSEQQTREITDHEARIRIIETTQKRK